MSILIFDTETTGLPLHPRAPLSLQPHIIEIAGVTMSERTGAIELEFSMLVNPGVALEPIITKITGLTDADLADAPTFGQILPTLRQIFGDAKTVTAHNLPFDRTMVRNELRRLDVLDFPWPPREVCTLEMYAELYGFGPRLINVYERVMGAKLDQTHRAAGDVGAMVEFIQKTELWRLL